MTHAWQTFSTWFNSLQLWHWWSFPGLFDTTPSSEWKFQWSYVALIAACFIGAVILTFWRGDQQLSRPIAQVLWNNVWVGPILFFFRYQEIPVLGMDLWRFIQEVAIVAWLVVILKGYSKKQPQVQLQDKIEAYRNKYLPKPKTKRRTT